MPTHRSEFHRAVLAPITVQHPETGAVLPFEEYLELPAELRSNDEAAVVDDRFTPRVLEWLGYTDADWIYNRQQGGEKNHNRPDFLIRLSGATAFVVEDKNTAHDFSKTDIEQLRRYTAGTQGYALWTNGRTLIALQFFPGGGYKIMTDVAAGSVQLSLDEVEDSLNVIRLLFERTRFAEMPGILDRICVPEDEWVLRARPLETEEAQREFISETAALLTKLSVAARSQINMAERDMEEARVDFARVRDSILAELTVLLRDVPQRDQPSFRASFEEMFASPANVDEGSVGRLKPSGLSTLAAKSWDTVTERLLEVVLEFRERESARRQSMAIHSSFQIWKERFRIIEGNEQTETPTERESRRRTAYADQVSYTFFIRLLLARTLEDKHVIKRLISDGGLDKWRAVSSQLNADEDTDAPLHGRALLDVLFQSVSRFYQHFFNQPVFDWFIPDDYLLAISLERLGTFSFERINRDILGFAYEAYVDRAFRNQKGHFLTRAPIVDYILDEANFRGREIIGRRVLDPAAGSGSFLVQAARRLRAAIEESLAASGLTVEQKREQLALQFVERIQLDLVGFEINPFSCYLAELNLFLQVLDDLVYLWQERKNRLAVEEFAIFNTDSLILPSEIMNGGQGEWEGDGLHRDQAREVKIDGKASFDYVVMNPPYINRAIAQDSMDLTSVPFYRAIFGGGDTNYYLAFLRVANYYVADEGVVAAIVPLNLLGDQSAGTFRRWLAAPLAGDAPVDLSAGWTLRSVSRFFSRTELFEGVLQGVCVVAWTKQLAEDHYELTLAGGWNLGEARENRIRVRSNRVLAADPVTSGLAVQDLWYNAWLAVPSTAHLDLWERIRTQSRTDIASLTANRVVFQQGDVNMTRTKPLRSTSKGGRVRMFRQPIATAGSKDIDDFGPARVSGELDAGADVSSMGLTARAERDCEREREERLQRILRLNQQETVAVIRDIVGLESARPIRGAMYFRGGGLTPIAFEHTLQLLYPVVPRDSELVEAIFGFLVSSVSNYVLSLFSTNAHVTMNELKRLPIPSLSVTQLGSIAALSREVQRTGTRLSELRTAFSGASSGDLDPDPSLVLERSDLAVETLDIAAMRGHLEMHGDRQRKVSVLWARGDLTPVTGADAPYVAAARMILASSSERYAESTAALPTPQSAPLFLAQFDQAVTALQTANDEFLDSMAALDRGVLQVYGISEGPDQQMIGRGLPWASSHIPWASAIADRL